MMLLGQEFLVRVVGGLAEDVPPDAGGENSGENAEAKLAGFAVERRRADEVE